MTPPSPSRNSALSHLTLQWFSPVMGWAGLSLAWQRGAGAFGESAQGVALACALIALAIFAVVGVGSVLRATRMPKSLADDLAHPVRHAFAATLPVSVLLLAANAVAFLGPQRWIAVVWLGAVTLQAGVVVWVVARWLSGTKQWQGVTPALYVPAVGNIVVPLAGVELGYPMLSWFFFGIGMFFWPVLTAMILVRQVLHPMPERLQPSWFILLAPPAVGASAAAVLGAGAPILAAGLGIAMLCALVVATRVPTIIRQPFGMSFWAMSFPLAALAALVLRLSDAVPSIVMPAVGLLAVVSVIIVGLTLATVKGLRAGTLLAPEPVATIAVVNG